jgi:hypothetical protein
VLHDAYGYDAPEFTCIHINLTATHCTFDIAVNGTLAIADWGIRTITTDLQNQFTCDEGCADGDITYDIAISGIANSSSSGVGLTVPSDGDIRISSKGGNGDANPVAGLGFLNGTDFVLIHATIPSDARYYVNYTNNPSSTNNQTLAGGSGAFHSSGTTADCLVAGCGEGSQTNKLLKIGSNVTANDWNVPTVVSAEVLKSNPQQVRVLMSENIAYINSTITHFNMTTTGGGNAAVPAVVSAGNGSAYLYITLQNPADVRDVLNLRYTTADAAYDGSNPSDSWITDAVDSTRYASSGAPQSAEWVLAGHGNKLGNL